MNREDVLILGVPHTGNHFMLALIPEATHRHPGPHGHHGDWPELLEHADAVICPMRHPLLVAQSWRKRGKSLEDRELESYWRMQVDVVDKHKPYYICLDKPDLRDDQVRLINDVLGLDLDPGDWPVLRDRRIYQARSLTYLERSEVLLDHYAAAESFFDRWYS